MFVCVVSVFVCVFVYVLCVCKCVCMCACAVVIVVIVGLACYSVCDFFFFNFNYLFCFSVNRPYTPLKEWHIKEYGFIIITIKHKYWMVVFSFFIPRSRALRTQGYQRLSI